MHSTYIFDSTCAYSVAEVRVIAMAIGHVHTSLAVHVRTMSQRIRDETTTKP